MVVIPRIQAVVRITASLGTLILKLVVFTRACPKINDFSWNCSSSKGHLEVNWHSTGSKSAACSPLRV